MNTHDLTVERNKVCTMQVSLNFIRVGIILSIIILAFIFFPELYAYLESLKPDRIFTFVNAWDEETYLSYQGALGARNTPGYYGLYLVSFLHELGISGAIQNLLFDITLIPLTIFFVSSSIAYIVNNKKLSFIYAVIILFSSVLFNYSNPLIQYLYGTRHLSTVITGTEVYPSFIRAPNPLFSYFILSFFIWLSCKTKIKTLLLLPLAGLYYFVFQPYLYCLSIFFMFSVSNKQKSLHVTLLFNLFAFIVIATAAWFAYFNLLAASQQDYLAQLNGTSHIQLSRKIYIPLYTIVGCILFAITLFSGFLKDKMHRIVFITLILCTFFISNIQLITGLTIEIKNFQDYGNSLIGGLILIVFLESIRSTCLKYNYLRMYEFSVLAILLCIVVCSYYNFETPLNFENGAITLKKGDLFAIKNDPLHYLVLNTDTAAKISYSQPKMPALITSYTMNYPSIFNQCACFYSVARQAKSYLIRKKTENWPLDITLKSMQQNPMQKEDKAYCKVLCSKSNLLNDGAFKVLKTI